MGDAAGIGAEVVLKALSDKTLNDLCRTVIVGDLKFLRKTADDLDLQINFVRVEDDFDSDTDKIAVFDLENLPDNVKIGVENAVSGKASAEYIEWAVKLWKQGKIEAICTAPINKKSLSMGGYDYPGHTEFLAHLTDTKKFAMSFFADKLCVILLSTHVSLRQAIELITKENLIELIKFSHESLSKLLKRDAKIAVAGLNPHASEFGMFGNEEEEQIIPAIEECRKKFGIDVSGAYSPDTIFLRGYGGEFDAVIACYHDQATIAVKCLSFGASVNVTLGLPLIRTSVDHGTAYDIAGKNLADAASMKQAIKLAADLLKNR